MASETRLPPQDRQAEINLLGALLVDNDFIEPVMEIVADRDFYERRHAEIFRAITSLYADELPADLVTTVDRLHSMGVLDKVGGRVYLVELTQDVFSAAHSERYAEIVRKHSIARQAISLLRATANNLEAGIEPDEELAALLREIEEIDIPGKSSVGLLSDDAAGIMHRSMGVKSGFKDLDREIVLFENRTLTTILGTPGASKSAFAFDICLNAVAAGVQSVFFSIEMNKNQLGKRLLANAMSVSLTDLREKGEEAFGSQIARDTADRVVAACKVLIDDRPRLNWLQIYRSVRAANRIVPIGLVVIDHLQMMGDVTAELGRGRTDDFRLIALRTGALKTMAKKLNIPVVLLSHVDKVTSKSGKAPGLADGKGSGAIEQDSDLIIAIHPHEWGKGGKPNDWPSKAEGRDFWIRKNRQGPNSVVTLPFWASRVTFIRPKEFSDVQRDLQIGVQGQEETGGPEW